MDLCRSLKRPLCARNHKLGVGSNIFKWRRTPSIRSRLTFVRVPVKITDFPEGATMERLGKLRPLALEPRRRPQWT
jgi:hypothetical protein